MPTIETLQNYPLSTDLATQAELDSISVDVSRVFITKNTINEETVPDYTKGALIGYFNGLGHTSGTLLSGVAYPLNSILEIGYTLDEFEVELQNSSISWAISEFSNLMLDKVYGYSLTDCGLSVLANNIYGYHGGTLVHPVYTSQYIEWQNSSGEILDGTPYAELPAKAVNTQFGTVFRQPVVVIYAPPNDSESSHESYVSFVVFKDYQAVQSGSHTEYVETSATYNYDSYVDNTYVSKSNLSSNVGKLNTTYATGLPASSNESFANSINLHKISKTGSYNDLLNKPDLTKYAEAKSLSSYTELSTTRSISTDIQSAVVHKTGNETLSGDLYLYHTVKNKLYGKYAKFIYLPINGADTAVRIIFDENPLAQLSTTFNIKYTLELTEDTKYGNGRTVLSTETRTAPRVIQNGYLYYGFDGFGTTYTTNSAIYPYANIEIRNIGTDQNSDEALSAAIQSVFTGSKANDFTYETQQFLGASRYLNSHNLSEAQTYINNTYRENEYETATDRFLQENDLEYFKYKDIAQIKNNIDSIKSSYATKEELDSKEELDPVFSNWLTATNHVSIGEGSTALSGIAIGKDSYANNTGIAMGIEATAGGANHVAIGNYADGSNNGVAIGSYSHNGIGGVAIGLSADTGATLNGRGIAIGSYAKAYGTSTAIGLSSYAYTTNRTSVGSLAVGSYSTALSSGSIAIGGGTSANRARATTTGAIQIGTGTNDEISSLQVFDYKLLDSDGNIPEARLSVLGYAKRKAVNTLSIASTSSLSVGLSLDVKTYRIADSSGSGTFPTLSASTEIADLENCYYAFEIEWKTNSSIASFPQAADWINYPEMQNDGQQHTYYIAGRYDTTNSEYTMNCWRVK